MARVSGVVPNLINGVSQQPPQLRLPTQGEAQENCHSSALEGLTKRPPTTHRAKLLDSLATAAHVHIIDRDESERYVVTIPGDGTISVRDFDGVAKTVTVAPGAATYLTVTNPKENLRVLSVADYTFILNRTVEVELTADVFPVRPYEALIHVVAGNYGKTYKIAINGTDEAIYETPDGSSAAHTENIDTSFIANQLREGDATPDTNNLVDQGFNTSPWAATRHQNAIYLRNTSTDFKIAVEDGYNGNAMKVAKTKVQRFTDLPAFGPHGFVIQVVGDTANNYDNYWLQFQKEADSNQNSDGVWVECPAPGALTTIDQDTMPHALIRQGDGTFTFGPLEWGERACGNEELVPAPSFIGSALKDVFFHKNRFGVLCDESIVMSRPGDFFNFWRQTLVAVLDDDPIDISSTNTKISLLERAIPFDGRLILFAKQTQFELAAEGYLSPNTVSLTPKSNYEIDVTCAPVADGRLVYFSNKRGDYGSVYEFNRDEIDVAYKATDTTAHLPRYVPNNISKLEASYHVDTLVALTSGDTDALYVYKSYWSGTDKLQSSWSRWVLPGVTEVLDCKIIEASLYLVLKRSDSKVYLESMLLAPGAVDTGTTYMTFLDRKVSSAALAAGSYNAGTDRTTYTLSYSVPEADESIFVVATRELEGDDTAAGESVPIISITGTSIVVDGDTTAMPLWFGYGYTAEYTFSTQLVRQATQSGGQTVVSEGRLQLHYLTLQFGDTSYFTVEVTPEDRDTKTYIFNRPTMTSSNPLQVESGRYKVPVLSYAGTVEMKIVSNSYLPFAILSAEWTGQFITRHQRIS